MSIKLRLHTNHRWKHVRVKQRGKEVFSKYPIFRHTKTIHKFLLSPGGPCITDTINPPDFSKKRSAFQSGVSCTGCQQCKQSSAKGILPRETASWSSGKKHNEWDRSHTIKIHEHIDACLLRMCLQDLSLSLSFSRSLFVCSTSGCNPIAIEHFEIVKQCKAFGPFKVETEWTKHILVWCFKPDDSTGLSLTNSVWGHFYNYLVAAMLTCSKATWMGPSGPRNLGRNSVSCGKVPSKWAPVKALAAR